MANPPDAGYSARHTGPAGPAASHVSPRRGAAGRVRRLLPRAGDGTRTRACLADNEVLLPLSYASMAAAVAAWYPEQESNLQHTGSEPAASPVGLPGHRGQPRYRTEQAPRARRRCTPVHRPWSQRPVSNRLRPCTRRVHHQSCCAGAVCEPAAGLEPAASGVQARCAYPRRLTGVAVNAVPSARLERAHDQDLGLMPLPELGHEGEAGDPGFEPEPTGSEPVVLPSYTNPHRRPRSRRCSHELRPMNICERLPGLEPGTSTLATSRSSR